MEAGCKGELEESSAIITRRSCVAFRVEVRFACGSQSENPRITRANEKQGADWKLNDTRHQRKS
jgi:hypothetical protein